MRVDIGNWMRESLGRIRTDGMRGLAESLYYAYVGGLLSIATHLDIGVNIFKRDWDLLVILDACRVDALREVADEYEFINDVDSMWSVASTSPEWHALTFREQYRDEISETAYVTANVQFEKVMFDRIAPPTIKTAPFSPSFDSYSVVSPSDFARIDPVYRYAHDDELGVVPPRKITERAIDVHRSDRPNREIVHYLQPHTPYIGVENPPETALQNLKAGQISKSEVWESYLDTLRLVLDDVEILLENVDADTVAITADHGEAMGEWGFHSHNIGCPHPVVRKVPWATTSAVDAEIYEPTLEPESEIEPDTQAQLEDLGYL